MREHTARRLKGNIFHTTEQGDGPSELVVDELSRQLYDWREHLPPMITWNDQSMYDIKMSNSHPNDPRNTVTPLDPALVGMLDFKITLNASLRTRFKYAEYIIWRPFIFKVMHSPQSPSSNDIERCRKAFEACTLWPLTFPIFHSQRRLIPHIYEYTHTFFGILLLLHTCSLNQFLAPLLHLVPAASVHELSIDLYLAWMRDMKVVHPLARWCWELLRLVYTDHKLVKDLEEA